MGGGHYIPIVDYLQDGRNTWNSYGIRFDKPYIEIAGLDKRVNALFESVQVQNRIYNVSTKLKNIGDLVGVEKVQKRCRIDGVRKRFDRYFIKVDNHDEE